MFVKAVKDNKGGRDGFFCSLVEARREKGRPKHKLVLSFGYVEKERIPYLRAAFNEGDPAEILQKELTKMEETDK